MTKRNTVQKDVILSTLRGLNTHPTAPMLYEEIHSKHPAISRSTVYRVLGQMVEDGTVLRLGIAGTEDRYDGDTSPHSHIRCRACGRVDDLPMVEVAPLSDCAGYLVEGCAVEYVGCCPKCRTGIQE